MSSFVFAGIVIVVIVLVSLDSTEVKSNDCDNDYDGVDGKMIIMRFWN